MTDNKDGLICHKCNKVLVEQEVTFEYLGREFQHHVPTCPKCGQVYISEKLVEEKISSLEQLMEGK